MDFFATEAVLITTNNSTFGPTVMAVEWTMQIAYDPMLMLSSYRYFRKWLDKAPRNTLLRTLVWLKNKVMFSAVKQQEIVSFFSNCPQERE